MDRPALKLEAQRMLSSHFPFFLVLFLPVLLLDFASAAAYYLASQNGAFRNQLTQSGTVVSINQDMLVKYLIFSTVLTILVSLLTAGMMFRSIDLLRNKAKFDQPVNKSFTIFNNWQYFKGAVIIGILTSILAILWSILFLIPGIIKSFSYVQSINIYRDALDAGKPIGYLEAITQSRQMMNGHKWEYFVMDLSFIGWEIVEGLTFGIASLWVEPYITLSFSNFYIKLADRPDQDDLSTIFKKQHDQND
ncbi:MAG: DUF975 family protein [Lentilactobacillus diolivorans]|jgi:uncharacterized membrane protein|uniref:Integral membrane protein n=2 Tax=Lentilactobacillus diolivorans TaxID=179838 RepID=A0A0R1SHE0_9LACO|nr:DUF975 family protein [Lentilactobacillus diolivorans]KRL65219.1 hypothetical protein FC85_GL000361 [Lentilactobacillus diolivorans DSM 14421]MCH4165485.1 DUF975 family protein [Lentilactobacillus diolivorans]RRG02646.1 MAG: DUF975 family protein [Lactobacillus sp.]GEP25344.1 membrane protein [Lentilactobacillus diolivorans]